MYQMISIEDIYKAYYDCRKNKRNTLSALEFEIDYEAKLYELWVEVNNRTYSPSESIAFIVTKPRRREIFAANFRDRVLHHLIDIKLRPLIEEDLIPTTCNNRVGKGTEGCVRYIEQHIKDCTENYTKDAWICKIDMKGFFMSIRKSLLIKKITEYTRQRYKGEDIEDVVWLLDVILSDNPEKHCRLKSDKSEWDKLDKEKSLFFIDDDLGLPIGNLISQLLANFYINEFDHYLLDLGLVYIARYVDDTFIIHNSKEHILRCMPLLRNKLQEVGVTLHPNKFYLQHYTKGVEMVGAVIRPGRIYVHNRTINNAFRAIERLNKLHPSQKSFKKVLSVTNSYLGFMKHRASFNLRKRLVAALRKRWNKYFYTYKDYGKISLKNKYKLRQKIKQQLRYVY